MMRWILGILITARARVITVMYFFHNREMTVAAAVEEGVFTYQYKPMDLKMQNQRGENRRREYRMGRVPSDFSRYRR